MSHGPWKPSALQVPEAHRLPLPLAFKGVTASDLAALTVIEQQAHAFAWGETHFSDCLNAGYDFVALTCAEAVAGYYVAMSSLDEVHLLNITVAPTWQRRGYGRLLLQHLLASAVAKSASAIWLEVRPRNTAALALYADCGFAWVRRRKDYYPAEDGTREDALVMKLDTATLLQGLV